jgi:hypothetical protein
MCTGLAQWHAEQDIGLRAATLLKKWVEAGLLSHAIYTNN